MKGTDPEQGNQANSNLQGSAQATAPINAAGQPDKPISEPSDSQGDGDRAPSQV